MKIHDRIHVVGGGDNSFGLSNRLDCTVYLLDGGQEGALIDAGSGLESEKILENLSAAGFAPSFVRKILLTHAHADHCGGAAALARSCGAAVYAGQAAAEFVSRGDMEAMSVRPAIDSGIYPPDYQVARAQARPLNDGAMITVGDLCLRSMDLPGHSDGHMGFCLEYGGKKLLFSGDLVFGKAKISLQKTWDCRLQPYWRSLRRVQDLKIDSLLTGHQAFCLNGAYRILDRVLASNCVLPGNL